MPSTLYFIFIQETVSFLLVAEDTDASITSKTDNRSLSPLDNLGTQTAIVMTEEKVTDLSPDQGGYDLHPTAGAYGTPYCFLSTSTAGVSDCLPSDNPVEQISSLIHGTTFVDQVMGDIYKHYYNNKLLISLHDRE